ncbi:hypothetical protein C8J57DRAFT_511486 [Mycena rebaudengoi]|nr:hypothetical protein C8J57DRAFT_511486 [Mycena rebaudengoi]
MSVMIPPVIITALSFCFLAEVIVAAFLIWRYRRAKTLAHNLSLPVAEQSSVTRTSLDKIPNYAPSTVGSGDDAASIVSMRLSALSLLRAPATDTAIIQAGPSRAYPLLHTQFGEIAGTPVPRTPISSGGRPLWSPMSGLDELINRLSPPPIRVSDVFGLDIDVPPVVQNLIGHSLDADTQEITVHQLLVELRSWVSELERWPRRRASRDSLPSYTSK